MSAARWRWRGSVALLAIAVAFFIYPLVESSNSVVNSDWPAFATGARMILHDPGRLYDLNAQKPYQDAVTGGRLLVTLGIHGILPFLAPAWVALLAVPFDALGTDLGGRAWIVFGLLCLGAGLVLAVRPRRPAAALPAFASVPTALMLLNAQLDGLVAMGVGAALALWSRPYLAGLALGLTLMKPQLVLPIGVALLVTRRWKVLAGWAAAGVVLTAAPAVLNPRWVLEWASAAGTTVQAGAREVDLAHFAVLLPVALRTYGAALLVAAGVAGTLALAARRRDDFNAAAAIVIAGGVLAAPHALPTDFALIAVGLAVWGKASWFDWLVLSAGALVAALTPAPAPAVVGVVVAGWACLRAAGRLSPSRSQAPESSPSTAR